MNDINWFDQLIEKNNISLYDQKKGGVKKKPGAAENELDDNYKMEQ